MLSGTVKITSRIIITCEQGDKRKMKVNDIIAIRTSSGTVKAGLKSFIRLFEKRTDLKEMLNISDEDIKALVVSEDVMGKIYSEINNVKID